MNQVNLTPFEGLGESYMLSDHAGDAELQMAEYRRCADRLKSDKREQVLDWGCGFGHLANELDSRGITVSLFDYTPDAADTRVVKLTQYPHLSATVSSEEVTLPYPEASFDAVVSMGTLEHVQNPRGSLSEIRRVLRPGGLLYVHKLPNRWSYVEYLAKRTGRYYHGALPNDRVYTLHTALELVRSSGFLVVESKHANMLPLMSVSRRVSPKLLPTLDRLNQSLSKVPGLRLTATNVEMVAIRPDR